MKEKTTSKSKNHRIVARNSRSHRLLALRAAAEAKRVLPIFEKKYPNDPRPRQAIEAIKAWAQGKRVLGMAEVRQLSLGSHAAAREANTDAARFAARAAGQAVATWHVPTHAMAVPTYANKAIAASKDKTSKKSKRYLQKKKEQYRSSRNKSSNVRCQPLPHNSLRLQFTKIQRLRDVDPRYEFRRVAHEDEPAFIGIDRFGDHGQMAEVDVVRGFVENEEPGAEER